MVEMSPRPRGKGRAVGYIMPATQLSLLKFTVRHPVPLRADLESRCSLVVLVGADVLVT